MIILFVMGEKTLSEPALPYVKKSSSSDYH